MRGVRGVQWRVVPLSPVGKESNDASADAAVEGGSYVFTARVRTSWSQIKFQLHKGESHKIFNGRMVSSTLDQTRSDQPRY